MQGPGHPRRAQRPGELGCWGRKCGNGRGPDPTDFSRDQATGSDTAGAGSALAEGSSLWPSFRTPPRPGLGRPWRSTLRLSEVCGAVSEQLDSGSRVLQRPVFPGRCVARPLRPARPSFQNQQNPTERTKERTNVSCSSFLLHLALLSLLF